MLLSPLCRDWRPAPLNAETRREREQNRPGPGPLLGPCDTVGTAWQLVADETRSRTLCRGVCFWN